MLVIFSVPVDICNDVRMATKMFSTDALVDDAVCVPFPNQSCCVLVNGWQQKFFSMKAKEKKTKCCVT